MITENTFYYVAALVAAGALWRLLAHRCHSYVIREVEVALLFRHGKLAGELGPGRHRRFGRGFDVVRFDARWRELVIQGQELLTGDNAPVRLTVVAVYRIAKARTFHLAAENPVGILYTATQLALRDLLGDLTLEDLIRRKDHLGEALQERLGPVAGELGIEIRDLALRDILLSGELKRALSGVVQARAEARSELERARGEAAASRTLANAARLFEKHEGLRQLRYLQVLEKSVSQPGTTIVLGEAAFPLPAGKPKRSS